MFKTLYPNKPIKALSAKLLMGFRRPHEDEDKYYAPNDEANSHYIP